jgi:type IV secretion system protein VirB10
MDCSTLFKFGRLSVCALAVGMVLPAQAQSDTPAKPAEQSAPASEANGWRRADQAKNTSEFIIEPGTRIPLSMINSISTKHAAEGDRIYLETVFPILANGRIVIPPGSYVAGTVTESKRPGRIKGRGELYVRFDSITLPNGITRDFRARMGSLDGRANEELDRTEGKIKSEGNKSGDAQVIAQTTAAGAGIGSLAGGAAGGHYGTGAGIGALAGATAGAMTALLTRGPDAVLAKGTTLEMLLDRPLVFEASDLDFSNAPAPRHSSEGGGPLPSKKSQNSGYPGRPWPF